MGLVPGKALVLGLEEVLPKVCLAELEDEWRTALWLLNKQRPLD